MFNGGQLYVTFLFRDLAEAPKLVEEAQFPHPPVLATVKDAKSGPTVPKTVFL